MTTHGEWQNYKIVFEQIMKIYLVLHLYSTCYLYVDFGTKGNLHAKSRPIYYDVIPYVSTPVFPESHLSVIQISGILTAPQSLSYSQSAGPGK